MRLISGAYTASVLDSKRMHTLIAAFERTDESFKDPEMFFKKIHPGFVDGLELIE